MGMDSGDGAFAVSAGVIRLPPVNCPSFIIAVDSPLYLYYLYATTLFAAAMLARIFQRTGAAGRDTTVAVA